MLSFWWTTRCTGEIICGIVIPPETMI
ncbi:hypothetical protein OIU77_019448, partial [Salix suchowensis]